jgi:hypothetical protein
MRGCKSHTCCGPGKARNRAGLFATAPLAVLQTALKPLMLSGPNATVLQLSPLPYWDRVIGRVELQQHTEFRATALH